MSWTKTYYLEHKQDGVWRRDERPWIPQGSPIDLNFLSDQFVEMQGLSFELDRKIEEICNAGFPHDASIEIHQKVDTFVQHLIDECCPLPLFGWLLVSDLLQLEMSGPVFETDSVRAAVSQWMEHLRSLGAPDRLRLIFMLWR